MSEDQPYFRFYPGAYEKGGPFAASTDVCEVCSRPCGWKYAGGVYAKKEITSVCARCIASDKLGKFFGGDRFSLHHIELNGAEPSLKDEVLRRTPGVACYNPFDWPVLDAKPMAFVGYGKDERLLAIPAIHSAIKTAFEEIGQTFRGPTSYALIFKEIDGERYRAVIDFD